jgi:hypothetical protein
MKMLKTKDEIRRWLRSMNIFDYTLHDDLTVDVNESIYLSGRKLKTIPIQFGVVKGDFFCDNNSLKTLKGTPHILEGSLFCNVNNIKNLSHLPHYIKETFDCAYNPIDITTIKEIGFQYLAHVCLPEDKAQYLQNYYSDECDFYGDLDDKVAIYLSKEQVSEVLMSLKEKALFDNTLKNKQIKKRVKL